MSAEVFLDTNIFVYSVSELEPQKAAVARAVIGEFGGGRGAISYQVVQEFCNVVLNKAATQMRPSDLHAYFEVVFRPLLAVESSLELFREGMSIRERFGVAWYDALIVAAAQAAGCRWLCSEDFQHGQRFGRLQVRNPFEA